jgi:hypothetical protein
MHWRFLRTVKVPNDDNFTISPRAIDAAVGVGPLHPLTCAHPRWSGENPSVLHPMPPSTYFRMFRRWAARMEYLPTSFLRPLVGRRASRE